MWSRGESSMEHPSIIETYNFRGAPFMGQLDFYIPTGKYYWTIVDTMVTYQLIFPFATGFVPTLNEWEQPPTKSHPNPGATQWSSTADSRISNRSFIGSETVKCIWLNKLSQRWYHLKPAKSLDSLSDGHSVQSQTNEPWSTYRIFLWGMVLHHHPPPAATQKIMVMTSPHGRIGWPSPLAPATILDANHLVQASPTIQDLDFVQLCRSLIVVTHGLNSG